MDPQRASLRAARRGIACVAWLALASAAPASAADRPELTAEVIDVGAPSAPTAQKVSLGVRVSNSGAADSPQTSVRFYRSADSKITTADTLVTTERLRAVTAGYTRTVYGEVKVGTTPGKFWFGACVVPVPDEVDPSNDCTGAVPIEVGKRPNLTVSDFVVTPTSLEPGNPMRFTALLRNSGTGAAGLAFVTVFRSSSPTGPPSSSVAYGDTAALASGESFEVSFEVNERYGAGTSWYGLCADPVPFETSTDDNCTAGTPVTVEGPDLALLEPSIDHSQVELGQSVTLTVEVRNLGNQPSPSTSASFRFDGPEYGGTVGTLSVPALAPGASVVLSMPKSADVPGSTELWACIDRAGDEITDNNCSEPLAFLVSGVRLDPRADSIRVGERNTLTGTGFTTGTVFMMYVAGAAGVKAHGPFPPDSFGGDYISFVPPLTIPLGDGFASLVAINTDQGYTTSNPVCVNLLGPWSGNPPSILAIDGVALGFGDCSVPFAYLRTTLTPGQPFVVTGSGFDQPQASLFTPAGNLGPLAPAAGWSTEQAIFTVPQNAPVGPASVQVVSAPYSGIASSNAVLVAVGEPIAIDGVAVNGATITVSGHGFSTGAVINLFNAQGGSEVNLGGLDSGGAPLVPLTSVAPTSFQFQRPAGAVAGKAFVEVLNPPFIPVTSTGNDPDGAFDLP